MGLMDKLTGGSKEESEEQQEPADSPEMYDGDDLSDEVTVWFVDPWPANKALVDYDLIFMVDEAVDDPIVLHCGRELSIPAGTQMLAYNEMVSVPWQDTTVNAMLGLLVDPDIVEFTGEEDFFAVPEPMQGQIIPPRQGNDTDLVKVLVSGLAAANQGDSEEATQQG